MNESFALKHFTVLSEAKNAAIKLEANDISSRVVTEADGIFATLFVNPDQADQAAVIIADDGIDVPPPSEPINNSPHESDENELWHKVSHELEVLESKKTSPLQNISALIISLILFISLGFFKGSFYSILILVGVIFIHECGHFSAMKLLKYKDIQMFFIPLFGAAVSGKETTPSGPRKAIVSLAGPLPGIVIGIITAILYIKLRYPVLADTTRMFLFLNVFNLLPLHPFDGGRFLDAVLFSRHPRIEMVFKVITLLIMGWLAFVLRDIIFGFFAFFVLVSLRSTHISASVAHALRKNRSVDIESASSSIPPSYIQPFLDAILEKLPNGDHPKPKILATYISNIWLRVINKPCSIGAATGLIITYIASIVIGIGSSFAFEAISFVINDQQTEVISRTLPDGTIAQFYRVTVKGHTTAETQINQEGFFDGLHTSWHLYTTNQSQQGQWKDGYWHGVWKLWNPQGELTEINRYDMGQLVEYRRVINGQPQVIPSNEWPRARRIRQTMPNKISTD